jgi:APA family basic amino acid/polyamine antiporter
MTGLVSASTILKGFHGYLEIFVSIPQWMAIVSMGILWAIVISTSLYFLVALVCSVALPLTDITSSNAPLALIIKRYSNLPTEIIGAIGLIAILNGALVQMIMVSRMFYGLSKLGVAPSFLKVISAKTHTPISATLITVGLILIMALLFPLGNLARLTSTIILFVFGLICAALIKIKLKKDEAEPPRFQVPIIIPALGLVFSILFLII